MPRLLALACASVLYAAPTYSAEIMKSVDADAGWDVYTLSAGSVTAKVVPAAGCNVVSLVYNGVELFHTPEKLADAPGVGYGNPVLYPSPNRVRDAQFTFEGRTYKFPPNNGSNFIHGLVHSEPWNVVSADTNEDSATLVCELSFAPGEKPYELFSLKHTLRLKIQIRNGAARWTYTVDNSYGEAAVPFGFALHPYFKYIDPRDRTRLYIDAPHHMRAIDLLPTGELEPVEGSQFAASERESLAGFVVDDVYFFDAPPQRAAAIEHYPSSIYIGFHTSPEFTHLVVYTPENRPFFCIENQTCSTDAHNLHAAGKKEVAHLQICPAGDTRSGWVEYRIASMMQTPAAGGNQ